MTTPDDSRPNADVKTSSLLDRAADAIEKLTAAVHGEFCSVEIDPSECTDLTKGRGCAQFIKLARGLRYRAFALDDD